MGEEASVCVIMVVQAVWLCDHHLNGRWSRQRRMMKTRSFSPTAGLLFHDDMQEKGQRPTSDDARGKTV